MHEWITLEEGLLTTEVMVLEKSAVMRCYGWDNETGAPSSLVIQKMSKGCAEALIAHYYTEEE